MSRFTVGTSRKSVARAFAVTERKPLAAATGCGEPPRLLQSEVYLSLIAKHFGQRNVRIIDISQPVAGKYEVVAAVHVAARFDNCCVAAGGCHTAHTGHHTGVAGQGALENLYKDFAHVARLPFVKHGAQEVPPLHRTYAPWGQHGGNAFGRVGQLTPVRMLRPSFHDGGKLQVAATDFPKKTIEGPWTSGCVACHNGHRVPIHLVSVQQFDGLHHLFPRRPSTPCRPIAVVQPFGAVNRQTHQKVMLMQELTPSRCQERAICLHTIFYGAALSVFLLQGYGFAIKVHAPQ